MFGFFGIHASAQTLAQAKILYEKGQYEQAKPVFKKFVKSQPNNGNYNLWYGVCCLNTGEAEEAIKVSGNSRKTPGHQRTTLFGTGL